MTEPSCETCRFWRNDRCKRFPPVAQQVEWTNERKGYRESGTVTVWPETDSTDWCGEYSAEANSASGGRYRIVASLPMVPFQHFTVEAENITAAVEVFRQQFPSFTIQEIEPDDPSTETR